MSASEHNLVWELLPAYALGALEAAEATDVARHVTGCPECRAELSDFERLADALALAVPEAAPPAALRGRLLAAVQGEQAQGGRGAGVQGRSSSPRLPRSRAVLRQRKALPVYGLLALAAIVLGGLLWAAVGRLAMGEAVVTLVPSDVAPSAAGELRFGGGGATLEVVGLPVLPPAQQYQLWVVREEQRASGAIFSVNGNGWAEVPVTLDYPAAEYDRFGITIEPTGGSPGPTGERVLGWRRE